MARVARRPQFLAAFLKAVRRAVPRATIDVEPRGDRGDRYAVAVMSPQFERMDWRERNKVLWDVAYQTLKDDELLRVSTIAVRPSDLNGG